MLVLTPLHKAGKLEATSGAEFSYVSMGCDQSHGQNQGQRREGLRSQRKSHTIDSECYLLLEVCVFSLPTFLADPKAVEHTLSSEAPAIV